MVKKEVKVEELENANGGTLVDEEVKCSHCGHVYMRLANPIRQVGEGCDQYYESQCPQCHEWTKLN